MPQTLFPCCCMGRGRIDFSGATGAVWTKGPFPDFHFDHTAQVLWLRRAGCRIGMRRVIVVYYVGFFHFDAISVIQRKASFKIELQFSQIDEFVKRYLSSSRASSSALSPFLLCRRSSSSSFLCSSCSVKKGLGFLCFLLDISELLISFDRDELLTTVLGGGAGKLLTAVSCRSSEPGRSSSPSCCCCCCCCCCSCCCCSAEEDGSFTAWSVDNMDKTGEKKPKMINAFPCCRFLVSCTT